MSKPAIVVALFASAVLMGCVGLFAQAQNGRITVQVTDRSGAVVPHAQIGFRPPVKAVPKNAETNDYGSLSLTMPPGDYEMFVTFPWFKPWAKKIRVHEGESEKVSVVLAVPNDETIVRADTPDSPMYLNAPHPAEPPRPVPIAIEVTDDTGAAVSHAQVWVGGVNTRAPSETDERGSLNVALIPDDYYIEITSPSLTRWRQRLQIRAGMPVIRVVLTQMRVP